MGNPFLNEGVAAEIDVYEKDYAPNSAESKRKYNMPLIVMPESVCYRVCPRVVLAWLEKEFPFNSTRWEFELVGKLHSRRKK